MSSTALALPLVDEIDLRAAPANDRDDPVAEWLLHDAFLRERESREVRVRTHVGTRDGAPTLVAKIEREGELAGRIEGTWSGKPEEREELRAICEGWCGARRLRIVAWEDSAELPRPTAKAPEPPPVRVRTKPRPPERHLAPEHANAEGRVVHEYGLVCGAIREGSVLVDGVPHHRAEVEAFGRHYGLSLPASDYSRADARGACEAWAAARGLVLGKRTVRA